MTPLTKTQQRHLKVRWLNTLFVLLITWAILGRWHNRNFLPDTGEVCLLLGNMCLALNGWSAYFQQQRDQPQ